MMQCLSLLLSISVNVSQLNVGSMVSASKKSGVTKLKMTGCEIRELKESNKL